MIHVDPREGSRDLASLLTTYGSGKRIKVEMQRMDFADFAFDGNGPHGKSRIGIERKKLRDLLGSIETGRLAGHQLPGLLENYDYIWIIVEGLFRGDPNTGVLEEPRGMGKWKPVSIGRRTFMFATVDNFLNSLATQTPCKIKVCGTAHDTATAIINLYTWWQKDWRAHKSCKVIYDPFPARAYVLKPTFMRRVANQLPGVGWEKSEPVDTYFSSVLDMCIASVEQWQQLPGIGKMLATRIIKLLNGEIDEDEL
ncbi:hypothetical protein LCGC14_2193670 [marine sediment metagenome]|uniref:ERCC4 domain-containing protein n=1 Tax=marine sediment metagenome TaxID=412755 RepID=A0A0F9DIW9_9ZZZZ